MFTKAVKNLLMEVVEKVITGAATKWEGATTSGWRFKAYRVGTYFRVDIFPPDHGGK